MLSGERRISGCADVIRAGSYVYEPVENVDTWEAVGDEPCVIHIEVNGRIEYLDDNDDVVRHTDASTARVAYLDWCQQTGRQANPDLIGGP